MATATKEVDAQSAANQKALIKERGTHKGAITRLLNYLNAHPDSGIDEVKTRQVKLEEAYQAYHKVQLKIEFLSEDDSAPVDNDITQFENLYYSCAELISKRLRELNTVNNSVNTNTNVNQTTPETNTETRIIIKQTNNDLLPKIEIKPFDGNPLNWYSFRDSFENLVHNNQDLLPVHKFYMLQNALKGSLSSITENLNPSEENYRVAWDILKQRCDKPRQIIQLHLNSLFELPEINKESPSSIRSLVEKAQMHINALKALNQPIKHWDTILVFMIVKKLDKVTRRTWERTLDNEDMPSFDTLIKFLNKQARGDEINSDTFDTLKSNNRTINHNSKTINKRDYNNTQSYVGTQTRSNCAICNNNHAIFTCTKFLGMNEKDRSEAVKKAKLCMNCLRDNHQTIQCYAQACKKCNRKHNTLLHFTNSYQNQNNIVQTVQSTNQDEISPTVNAYSSCNSEVFLGTACIKILDRDRNEISCRVLLDGGSQTNFITEKLAEKLKLDKIQIDKPFAGLGQNITKAQYAVKATIKSKTPGFVIDSTFVALPVITGLLPTKTINKHLIKIPKNISLADPEFNKSTEIDALLGNTLFYQLLSVGQIKLNNNSIILQKTRVGWIVTGEINVPYQNINTCYFSTNLDEQLHKFWQIEEVKKVKYFSKEETLCEEHFSNTFSRDSNGKYIVKLPFNDEKVNIGDSYKMALKRFYSLEKKLESNQELKIQYTEFLREYLKLQHMSDITRIDNQQIGYYLPHHAVVKETSATTKVRVVFDGSAKTSNNISLNDTLMQGPTIQDELISIIMRFRTHKYVFTADIEKMYRQVYIHTDDSIYQKILWHENKNDQIKTYKLNTVTYGTTPAPFLAVRCLKQLKIDHADEYPLAAAVLDRDFYVDDLLTGTNTIQEAQVLIQQLIKLLQKGGFNLRQWLSNEPSLLKRLKDRSDIELLCLDNDTKKVLGIQWDPQEDTIKYSIKSFANERVLTKRTILSEIAQLFDPLGLLGPIIIKAKLIMQDLWKANLNWDESIPQSIYTEWMNFTHQLKYLNQFSVERKIIIDNSVTKQLHGFCDASEKGYGACIYIRSSDNFGNIQTRLVCAKSRVATIKKISLPRLELCAAKLLANLYTNANESLKLKFDRINFYTDSTITLNWIQTSPHSLKTFEANRVAEIQLLTNQTDWYHVSTHDNSADFISRGQSPAEFIKNQQWLHGPIWLSKEEDFWRITKIKSNENKTQTTINLISTKNSQPKTFEEANNIFAQFSSINALNRFVAYCHRIATYKTFKIMKQGELSSEEIHNAHRKLIKIIQRGEFYEELKCLQQHKELNNKSKLLRLNPFTDESGILRVGGRLVNANIEYSRKFPILLPRNNHVTKLIIRHEHLKNWHTGVQNTLNLVRQNYWPIDGKNITRLIIHKCIRCFKSDPKVPNYSMGNLPQNRVLQSRPFQNVGIDYCGPFLLKEKKFRNTTKLKSYVAVFVCFSTKAIHLELTTDLTTESCLAAIKRFFSRRGKSKNIYTDNGLNFIGAKNEILRLKALLLSTDHNNKIMHKLSNEGVNWHFVPPRAPHFGGLWEAGVKQFKAHLYRTVGDSLFTYEQFNTFIIEIEAILNSHPITPISSDPNDLSALTPAHFLIGDSLMSIPEENFQETPNNRLSIWQHIQKVKSHFWKRWHKDYISQLLTRSKWFKKDADQIKIGTLVIIKDDNLPPMHWCMGRVIAVHPGEDNIIRVATIKTACGTYKRPIKKLCPLPIDF